MTPRSDGPSLVTPVEPSAPAAPAPDEAEPATATEGPRRDFHLWRHVLVLAALLVVLLPLMSPRSAFTSDEGAYALQADALAEGSWAYDYRASDLDPDGAAFPLVLSSRNGDRFYPYVQHPAYPQLLRSLSAVAGTTVGLHLPALTGTVGTAVAGWLLVGEIDPRLRRRAFWLAALGPVLANGFLLWAHSLSAAVAGLTLFAVVRGIRRGPTVAWTAAAGCGAAAGVFLRSEGLLFALALASVAAGGTWFHRRGAAPEGRHTRGVAAAGPFVSIAGPAVVAAVVERVWVRSIVGGAYENLESRADGAPWLHGRVSAAWHDLFEGPLATGRGALVSLTLVAAVVALGVLARRRPSHAPMAIAGGALLATGLTAAVVLADLPTPVSGLLLAWPVALVGLVAVPWRRLGPTEALLAVTSAVFAFAVIVTEYPGGGGVQWGGRFFFPVLAPLAVLAVVGIDRRLAAGSGPDARRAGALIVVAVVAWAAVSLVSVSTLRARHARMTAAVARHPAPVTITTSGSLPRLSWAEDERITWMLVDPVSLPGSLSYLRSRGVIEVAVVTDRFVDRGELALFGRVEEAGEPSLLSRGLDLFVLRTE